MKITGKLIHGGPGIGEATIEIHGDVEKLKEAIDYLKGCYYMTVWMTNSVKVLVDFASQFIHEEDNPELKKLPQKIEIFGFNENWNNNEAIIIDTVNQLIDYLKNKEV